MDTRHEEMADRHTAQIANDYPAAVSAHLTLLERLELNDEPIDTALSVSETLARDELIALHLLMRAHCQPDRLDPCTVESWLAAYAIIADAVDPDAECERTWSNYLTDAQTTRFLHLPNRGIS